MKTARLMASLVGLGVCGGVAVGVPVDPEHRHAWGEGVGFLEFGVERAGAVEKHAGYLSGYVWGENIGWVSLGAGDGPYANVDGASHGVNIEPETGWLSGYAWGENVGWIDFEGGLLAEPANPARFEGARLRGYAWGENIGWVNLDHEEVYVSFGCAADFNGDGVLDLGDVQDFVGAFLSGELRAELSGDGVLDNGDIVWFVQMFMAACEA